MTQTRPIISRVLITAAVLAAAALLGCSGTENSGVPLLGSPPPGPANAKYEMIVEKSRKSDFLSIDGCAREITRACVYGYVFIFQF